MIRWYGGGGEKYIQRRNNRSPPLESPRPRSHGYSAYAVKTDGDAGADGADGADGDYGDYGDDGDDDDDDDTLSPIRQPASQSSGRPSSSSRYTPTRPLIYASEKPNRTRYTRSPWRRAVVAAAAAALRIRSRARDRSFRPPLPPPFPSTTPAV